MENIFLLISLFFIYSFLGWTTEVLLNLVRNKRFINRGFLIGPICPIYGVGGIIMYLTLNSYIEHPVVLFILATVTCSALEYFTSWIMEAIFKNRWWDYTHMKYNINGRICLEYAVFFGLGAMAIFYLVNPKMIPIILSINSKYLEIIDYSLLFIFVIDLCVSFDIILNLKNISENIRSDSSEIISLKVREILLNRNILYRRLVHAFPDMSIENTLSRLRHKLEKRREKIREEKERLKKERRELSFYKWKKK